MAAPTLLVTGVAELRKDLKKFQPALLPELRTELKKVGEVVASDARARLTAAIGVNTKRPSRSTGKAAKSIRVVAPQNTVYVRGGTAAVPYYGWLDYGGDLKPSGKRKGIQHRPYLPEGRVIAPAAAANVEKVREGVNTALYVTAQKAGFQ